ncbi:RING/U-box superfamily protein [Actinidia rufa]|uniref:RING/U-box superfamily protein n=1 Tax=Actinidia rufa TaxID=165716 RepID=A0A7J0FMZ6_9ERIC|nr:RING/U-box superfamily protein [Actinidia rufa]
MWQKQPHKSSYRESIKALEADIQHANTLAAALPRDSDGDCIQMKLSYSPFAPFLLPRKRSNGGEPVSTSMPVPPPEAAIFPIIFNALNPSTNPLSKHSLTIIYPSLKQLEGFFTEVAEDHDAKTGCYESMSRNGTEEKTNSSSKDLERENECGICMENCTKMVLPNCGHSMCNSCFHDCLKRGRVRGFMGSH